MAHSGHCQAWRDGSTWGLAEPGHDCYHLRVFGIGYLELLVLGLLIILLFPPKELPKLARQAARAYGSVRRIADDFHRTVMLDEDLRSPIDEIRGAYDEARWDIRRAGDQIKHELSSAGREVKNAVSPGALDEAAEPPTPEEQAYLDGAETLADLDTEPEPLRDPMSKFPARPADPEPSPLVGEASPGALVSGQVEAASPSESDDGYQSPYGPRPAASSPRRTMPAVPSPPDGRVAASGAPGTLDGFKSSSPAGTPTPTVDEPTQVVASAPATPSAKPARAGLPVPGASASPRPPTTPPPAPASQSRGSTSPGLAIPPQLANRDNQEVDDSALTRVTRLPKPPSLGDASQEPGQDPSTSNPNHS